MIQRLPASTERLNYQENKVLTMNSFKKINLSLYVHPHKKVKAMKQQKLFHLVLSAILIVCTTGCYDKDEIKDAEKYLSKIFNTLLKKKGMDSVPMM